MKNKKPVAYETYEQIAETYAERVKTKPHNAYLERPAVRALVPDISGDRVLDAGCGPGTNITWLIEQGAREVVGVEVSQNMLAVARRETSPERVSLHLADLSQPLDFLADSSFDLVFSSLVVHYLEDLKTLFAEFARLLRPGGRLVFSTHHPQADFHWHPGNYFETICVTEQWRGFSDEPVAVSFYRRPLGEITGALAEAGFVIERLAEAQPAEAYRLADPESYEQVKDRPSFLCVRARKE